MKKILPILFLAAFILSNHVAAEGSCKLCERVREANKGKVNPYEYYEDYLNANEGKSIGAEKTAPAVEKAPEAKPPVQPKENPPKTEANQK